MEQSPTIPPVEQPQQQPIVPQVEPTVKPRVFPRVVKTILSIIIVLLLGGWVGFWATKTVNQSKTSVQATPTPIALQPTPSNRQESVIATQSAFLTAVQSVASLSAALSTLTINDTLLNPPAVELPLGFGNN